MPSIPHEAPLELLRANPGLAAVLARALGVSVPDDVTAVLAPTDLSAAVPAELRADAVVRLTGADGAKLAVIVEVQLRYDKDKTYTWPAYLTQARAAHRCPAVLLVICTGVSTARRCREKISIGHPGFELAPLVLDAESTPDPREPGLADAGPELLVLAVLTGALDLNRHHLRRLVLAGLAGLDASRTTTYTVFILNAVPETARRALESLMKTTEFRDAFVDQFIAEGVAKGEALGQARGEARGQARGQALGEARMLLRVLARRGLQVTAEIEDRVLSCTDTGQLEAWFDRAITAVSVQEVFG